MAGRHQAQYTRYASSNPPYPNTNSMNNSNGGSNNSLGVPYTTNNSQQGHGGYSTQSVSSYNTTTPTMTSPYSTTSSPGHHSPNMQRYNTHSSQLRKYTLVPPSRLPPLSKTMSNLGHPGIYPQKPTQIEDIMTESNVRNGFIDRPLVSNEHTCAYDMVFGKLQEDQRVLDDLGSFAVDVMKRKRNAARITGAPSFKPPIRSTLIESKKEQWMNELASGTQPLRKLARNVPHGFKGEKLLETLAAKQVPFLRATWYIKVVGLSEMHQRNANNNPSSLPHAIQWTNVVVNHLRRQLSELSPSQPSGSGNTGSGRGYKAHPSTPSNYHDNASKPWATPENRERFEQKWSYSTKLTKWQYCEGLLDQRTFLRWTLDSLKHCNSFESMWLLLTFIVQDYVDEYRRNRTLMKLLIETLIKAYGALLQQLGQLSSEGLLGIYRDIQKYIERLLQSLFLSTPDIFVIPKLYHQYRHLFDTIFGDDSRKDAALVLPDVAHVMQKYWAMVKGRNEVFCGTLEENQLRLDGNCKHIVQSESRQQETDQVRQQVNEDHIIRTLDSIGRNIDSGTGLLIDENGWMDLRGQTAPSATNSIFNGINKDMSTMQQRVNIMCRWATSDSRHGDWRPYLVGSILLQWREQNPERKTVLQDMLIHFLDTQMESEEEAAAADDMMTDTANELKPAVVLLFDTLIRLHLFSYQKYILRLIARGDLEPRRRHEPSTVRCLNYLASFPLLTPAPPYLVNQRRVAIYGPRNGQMNNGIEDEVLAQLKRFAKRALAISGLQENDDLNSLFGPEATSLTQPDADDSLETMESTFTNTFDQDIIQLIRGATRYTILNFTSEWLVPELKRFVVKSVPIGEDNWRVMTSPGSCLLNIRQYVTIIKILEYAKDYLSIIEVALWVLEKTNERALYSFTVDTFRRHANIWKLVNNGKRVAEAIWAKHQSLQSRGTRERCLMMYMIQLVQEGYRITDDMRTQLQQDLHYKPKVRQYSNRNDTPLATELKQLIQNPSASAVHNTIDSICSRSQQNTSQGLYSMFITVFETLQQYGQERQINILATSEEFQQEHKEELYEFRQRICFMVDFLKGVADQSTLTGQLDDTVIQWLSQHCSPTSATVLDDLHESHTWLPLFLALLVTRRLICIDMILKHFVLPWFEVISREAQQRCESQWTETTAETRPLRLLCKNLIDLVEMLVVQDHCCSEQQLRQAAGVYHPWVLRADEIFQLQVQRQPQLATNLDKLDYMFGLVRNSIIIVSNLPYSSLLIQDLLKLRTDLLQLEWFRRACTRDVNSIYHHFATQHHNAGGEGEIRKKMLSIVDELIGGNINIGQDNCQDSMVPTDLLEPDFGQRLQAVFANLSQWNEEQCRVQLNLLLDNIMINQHSGTTTTSSSSTGVQPGTQDTTTDAMVIDTSPAPTATAATVSVTENGESMNKELDLFVKFFFDAVLASASDTETQQQNTQRRFDFLINLIHGLREPILLALLNHGVRMLEGINNNNNNNHSSEETTSVNTTSFPYTILLTCSNDNGGLCEPISSAQYGQRCQAFYLIMQHLLAKDVWSNEKKIDLIQTLFRQVEQFKKAMNVYKVMESVHQVSFADASRALQLAKNVDVVVTLLKTEGLPESEPTTTPTSVMLQDIRISLLLRLRLMVPFVSLIWEHPKEHECDILEWIKVLVPLLGNPIVHGNGNQERMFEFVLDLISLLIDEVPKDLRKTNLLHLSAMQNELNCVPSMLHYRVKRILPFLTHNIYLSNTRLASSLVGVANATDPQLQQQHLESCMEQSKPWEWLEDYASEQPHDNDTPISFSLFHGRKTKKTENTYIRWYHFGFGDGLPSLTEEDDDSLAIHVGMVGHRPIKRRRKIKNEEEEINNSTTTNDNGVVYKVNDQHKSQQHQLIQQKHSQHHHNRNQQQQQRQSLKIAEQQQQRKQQDMEDGELP
ncbi:hypothetical protein INT45_005236 [Circinella minor]|uniref:Mediator of RNA polymerase II transcription subunit 12 n=1 Tax=Circinella minor TaxID=1195481 RepID=A0A8H7S4J8_9FUNG|nr:hypothetical protein INT45_005236 [Circinella minor]